MINEEKVKIMTKLAMYEQGRGRKHRPVSRYYRSDYIGLALIKNFFLVTIGYVLIVAAVAVYFGEYLLENIHRMNLVTLGIYLRSMRGKKRKCPPEEQREVIGNDSITGI